MNTTDRFRVPTQLAQMPIGAEKLLLDRYREVRARTSELCAPLEDDDHGIQTMLEVSPPKWHLAHVTWYFETFVLARADARYRPVDERFAALFNSYYMGVGSPFPRGRRGMLSRPTIDEVRAYRYEVDARMEVLLARLTDEEEASELGFRIDLGLRHEEQHQELLLMDIKHILGSKPLRPVYDATEGVLRPRPSPSGPSAMLRFPGGVHRIGHGSEDFAFDNERPSHEVLLQPFALAHRLVRNDEYLAFIDDDGYARPELWLADGFTAVTERQWSAPEYWFEERGAWHEFTLRGPKPLDPAEPVAHLSYYEADAFARWAGKRLPTETEWEVAARLSIAEDAPAAEPHLHPRAAGAGEGLTQLFGELWQWTSSAYAAYPGFQPFAGELVEYNGKFMCNQFVLRGSACATPSGHERVTYRNFFYPHDRWAFAGIRLAEDA